MTKNSEANKRMPAPDDRQALLTELRRCKMARSPHAYVRGNTERFYEWVIEANGDSLPH